MWEKHPKIRRLKKEFPKLAKVPWQNYARRMHNLYPEVTAKFDVVKPELTAKQLAARYKFAETMMRHSQEFLDSIIFVDEASVEEKPTPDRVLTRRGEEALRTDSRLHPNKAKYEKIHFIEAVNGKLGFIDTVIASPTKGFTPKQQYVVSGQGGVTGALACRASRVPWCTTTACGAALA